MMKKILIILVILIVLFLIAAGALAYFILTFNPEKFRPAVIQKLEEVTGNPVRLDNFSLGWNNGLAVSLDGLAVLESPAGKPVLSVSRAAVLLRLIPLFHKDIEIGSLQIDSPSLELIRTSDGKVTLRGIRPKPTPAGKKNMKQAAPGSFFINSITVENGTVTFRDEQASPPSAIAVHNLELRLKKVSLVRPIEIKARAAVLSAEPNVRIEGKFIPPFAGRPGALENFHIETDLSKLRTDELASVLPQAGQYVLLQKEMAGQVEVSADRLAIPFEVQSLKASVSVKDGKIYPKALGFPLENVSGSVSFAGGELKIPQFSTVIAGGHVTLSGTAAGLAGPKPKFSLQAAVNQFDLEKITPPKNEEEPATAGILTASFQGSAEGLTAPEIESTLTGSGKLSLQRGVLKNFNVLREVFSRLSVIPSLVERLESRLPESYRAKLDERDTAFEPVEFPFAIDRGNIFVQDLRLASESFELKGTAHIDLAGPLNAQTVILIDPTLSGAMIRSVEELRYLTDNSGRLQIPLDIQGSLTHPRILPNVRSVATSLAATKAQEYLGRLLQNALSGNSSGEENQAKRG